MKEIEHKKKTKIIPLQRMFHVNFLQLVSSLQLQQTTQPKCRVVSNGIHTRPVKRYPIYLALTLESSSVSQEKTRKGGKDENRCKRREKRATNFSSKNQPTSFIFTEFLSHKNSILSNQGLGGVFIDHLQQFPKRNGKPKPNP